MIRWTMCSRWKKSLRRSKTMKRQKVRKSNLQSQKSKVKIQKKSEVQATYSCLTAKAQGREEQ
jgi:hypothetical protein